MIITVQIYHEICRFGPLQFLTRVMQAKELQQKFIAAFPGLSARLAAEPDLQAREEIMTREHMKMSEEAQTLALKLYRYLVYAEPV